MALKGIGFTRFAMALATTGGDLVSAHALVAGREYRDTPAVVPCMKAAMEAGTTSDATWAGPLVQYQNLQTDFIEVLRPATILGKLERLRRAPPNVRFTRQTAAVRVGWVGEGKPRPMGKLTFDNGVIVGQTKVSGIVALTADLVRMSTPAAEAIVRDDLLRSVAQFSDESFIDPTQAGLPGVQPAAITRGAYEIPSSGATVAAIDADAQAAIDYMLAGGSDLSAASWVMHPHTASRLHMKRDSGSRAFPDIGPRGGTWYGLPVITSGAVTSRGSPGQYHISLIDSSRVITNADDGILLDASKYGTLQMTDAPSPGNQAGLSLWQHNMVALMADRYLHFERADARAVVLIADVAY